MKIPNFGLVIRHIRGGSADDHHVDSPLSAVYRLGLLSLFNRFGHCTCGICSPVPTRDGFYTS